MTPLSPHFTLEEMTASSTGIRMNLPNVPNDAQIASLKRLCVEGLEPIRAFIGEPLHVDSGFRSPAINAAIGGASGSAHMAHDPDEAAADVKPAPGSNLRVLELFQQAAECLRSEGRAWDQLILEHLSWAHISIHGPKGQQRCELKMIFNDGKGYVDFDPSDPRLA